MDKIFCLTVEEVNGEYSHYSYVYLVTKNLEAAQILATDELNNFYEGAQYDSGHDTWNLDCGPTYWQDSLREIGELPGFCDKEYRIKLILEKING